MKNIAELNVMQAKQDHGSLMTKIDKCCQPKEQGPTDSDLATSCKSIAKRNPVPDTVELEALTVLPSKCTVT